MSTSSIPQPVQFRLWRQAGGRCEYEGCNRPLWKDELTNGEFNTSYLAHIVADKPDGPRGDPELSEALSKDISNLMLMCDVHHRLIDKADIAGHPVKRLQAMKRVHESRIELLTGIAAEKQSHIVLYGANIAQHGAHVSFAEAARSMVPERFPADSTPITITLGNSSFDDSSAEFWNFEVGQVRKIIAQQLHPRTRSGDIEHISVFAIAPQPLLMCLGMELSDVLPADVYQRRKEPTSWQWEELPAEYSYVVDRPHSSEPGELALIFALSAAVTDERIYDAVGKTVPTWRVSIPEPHNDFLRSKAQSAEFRRVMRATLNEMKSTHGENGRIHVFPAMPVSLAVEFGRLFNSKADLPLVIYDQNIQSGGFWKVLELP